MVVGHGEGWALYAERLMGELGYLDNPDYELGMLRAQAMPRYWAGGAGSEELPTDRRAPGRTEEREG